MMEAMQMGPAAYGPQIVGPGTGSVGGCVFDASIGRGAYSRLRKDNPRAAENAMAIDAATAFSEQKGEIGHYKLLVRNTTYRNKITDEIISEKTLVSPDFNYEAAGVWTSAGESGTVGTIAEYRGTVDRARELAQIDEDASMFWVSPASEGDGNRAYLWVKKGDEVEAYQYIIPGRREAISNAMKKLGYQSESARLLEDQTIIRKGNEPKIHHRDVYDATTSSLSPEEAKRAKSILDKFRQEVELPDSFRKQRLKNYQGEYEAKLNNEKLKKVYENDIEKWLRSVAQGFAAMANLKSDKNNSDVSKSSVEQRGGEVRKTVDKVNGDKKTSTTRFDTINPKDKSLPAFIQERMIRDLQSITPAVIVLISYGALYRENFQEAAVKTQDYLEKQLLDVSVKHEEDQKEATIISPMQALLVWQQTMIGIDNMQGEYLSIPSVFNALPNPERLHGIPFTFEQESIILREAINNKDDEIKVTRWQKTLEDLTHYMFYASGEKLLYDESNKDDREKMMVEEVVISIEKSILEELLIEGSYGFDFKAESGNKLENVNALSRLTFFIKLYEDEETSEELKHLLSALIYMQIKEIGKDRVFIDKTPQLSLLIQQFSELSPKSDFLGVRFFVMIETLEKLTKIKLLKTTDGQVDINTLMKKVFALIYLLSMRQNGVGFSPELLTNPQILKSKFILPNKKFSPGGIIYQYSLAQRVLYMSE